MVVFVVAYVFEEAQQVGHSFSCAKSIRIPNVIYACPRTFAVCKHGVVDVVPRPSAAATAEEVGDAHGDERLAAGPRGAVSEVLRFAEAAGKAGYMGQ
jgi:hypothetical protein